MTEEDSRLSTRKEMILRAIVEEYTRSARPVASDALARGYGLGVSSATVRNVMGELEDDGLIYQQHTSAGRMPTDLGYRYFVEHLMGESALSLEEQRLIQHQFYQVQHHLDEWVRLTASVLARVAQGVAIITPPQSSKGRLKHFELLSLHDTVALLVMVLFDGSVRQERLLLDMPASQEDLSRISRSFNDYFGGLSAPEIQRAAASHTLSPDEYVVAATIKGMLEQHDNIASEALYDGILNVLDQKEFKELGTNAERGTRIRQFVEMLEQNRVLPAIAPQVLSAEGVQVIIGGEHQWDQMKDLSVVAARYGVEGQMSGVLGIVGPTRMQYGRAIAAVRYLTEVMNDLLAERLVKVE